MILPSCFIHPPDRVAPDAKKLFVLVIFLFIPAICPSGIIAQILEGDRTIQTHCALCHAPAEDGQLSRITTARRTPEGWDMTITRMRRIHKAPLSDEEHSAIVKYLSDTQGLAPEETLGYRYALERQPNVIEPIRDEELGIACARCHTYARVMLQRRGAEEWKKLGHFHLGQFTWMEYHEKGRTRDTFNDMAELMPEKLAQLLPYDTLEWTAWQQAPRHSPGGTWRVVGHRPGRGDYAGTLEITAGRDDHYEAVYSLHFADGTALSGHSSAIVYTGYEWRGTGQLNGTETREIYALSKDGSELLGRWFERLHDEAGGELYAHRIVDNGSKILAVHPGHLRSGHTSELTIHGINLDGDVNLGPGITATIKSREPHKITLSASADTAAGAGYREVRVGDSKRENALTIYHGIDSVVVEPALAIARVGGGGGKLDPVGAQFEAIAYLNGQDEEPGTEDDVRIGVMPAQWSVEPANDIARALGDEKYAGSIDRNGLFSPGVPGRNMERKYGSNNVGELAVRATVDDGETELSGTAKLVVTVQRWVDTPIR